ncbi:MAG: selenocysteine-specific translation elongation factor, partial [Chloroflexota bacterium]|nr:selenocysteine-specific translation elongation factor [Chloroflexota bacterium]
MQIIGTAGHVDHGKSTLIKRLTGIDPDRLQQEQDREMSIELGFAWFNLPNGEEIGIIDVPGHRDFIENMLSGIGGIDAALFVVAADEGVMPQTREHLAILDLLQIPAGVVALTKIDLVKEPEWLDLVEVDLSETLAGTVLENAPIVRVSARSGAGIDKLVLAIQGVLEQHPHRPDLGRPRLPVDRVFTLPGFGTIVTGTLMDGQLTVGDPVEVLPSGIEGRVRGLQTHKQAEEKALPGSRTAVNIAGVSRDQIERGNTLVHPGTFKPTKMIDVWCTLLPDVKESLKHNTEVKLFIGAAEVMARVRLLGF